MGLATTVDAPDHVFAPISDPKNADLRQRGLRNASGVYLIGDKAGTVLYIGKATRGNLHEELWNKLRTPQGDTPPLVYPAMIWPSEGLQPGIARQLESGSVSVATIQVKPALHSALLEVFLQTLCCEQDGSLPILNSRIG